MGLRDLLFGPGGIREFLFGPRESMEEPPPGEHEYGRLAEGRKMGEELRKELREEEAKEEEEEEEEPEEQDYYLLGARKARRRLFRGLRRRPGMQRAARDLRQLEEKLEGAESREEYRRIARRSVVSPRGLFRRAERRIERRYERDLESLERRGASEGDVERFQRRWKQKYGRSMGKLERRLRRPGRYLRSR